jgi:hypothetical protein
MVADVEVDTAVVEIVNVAAVLPAAIVTDAGRLAAALLLVSDTVAPPLGAALPSVTVPWELLPPVTVVGLKLTELTSTPCVTVKVAVWLVPL